MFSYKKILKQAYEITVTNKFLWIFGLFLIFGNILNLVFNFQDELQFPKISWTWATMRPHGMTVAALLVLACFMVFMFFRSKASLIISIKAILDRQQTSAAKSFRVSQLFFGRILGLTILIQLVILVIGIVLVGPIAFMFGHHLYYRATMLLVLGIFIFLPILVISGWMNVLAPMFIVIYDLTINEAITKTLDLISAQWVTLVGLGVMLFFLELLTLFILMPIVFLADFPYHMVGLVLLIVAGLVFLLAQAIVSVYTQTTWVLAFLELVRPQKMTDIDPAIVPEIIS